MKLRSILTEAFLNISSGATKGALFAALFAALVMLLGGVEIIAVGNIEHQAAAYRTSGSSTLIYRLKAGISGQACDALREVPGVSAVGAIRQRGTSAVALALPEQQIPTYEVSPGFGHFEALGGVQVAGGILVSQDLAATLGVQLGGELDTQDGAAKVAGVFPYPADGRLPGYGYSIMMPADPRVSFDECWVEAWPASDDVVSLLPTVLLPGAAVPTAGAPGPQLQQLNPSHGTRFDGRSLLSDRITRFAPIVAGVIGAAIAFAAVFQRRIELASARHAGVAPSAQLVQLGIETLIWAIAGTVLSTLPLSVILVVQQSSEPLPLGLLAARVVVAAIPSALLGSIAASCLIRERSLFSYFKSR